MKAIVEGIQVGGLTNCSSLQEASKEYSKGTMRPKMHFVIRLPDKTVRYITIRDEDNQTVAYGDFEGLPSFLDYAKEVLDE